MNFPFIAPGSSDKEASKGKRKHEIRQLIIQHQKNVFHGVIHGVDDQDVATSIGLAKFGNIAILSNYDPWQASVEQAWLKLGDE